MGAWKSYEELPSEMKPKRAPHFPRQEIHLPPGDMTVSPRVAIAAMLATAGFPGAVVVPGKSRDSRWTAELMDGSQRIMIRGFRQPSKCVKAGILLLSERANHWDAHPLPPPPKRPQPIIPEQPAEKVLDRSDYCLKFLNDLGVVTPTGIAAINRRLEVVAQRYLD